MGRPTGGSNSAPSQAASNLGVWIAARYPQIGKSSVTVLNLQWSMLDMVRVSHIFRSIRPTRASGADIAFS